MSKKEPKAYINIGISKNSMVLLAILLVFVIGAGAKSDIGDWVIAGTGFNTSDGKTISNGCLNTGANYCISVVNGVYIVTNGTTGVNQFSGAVLTDNFNKTVQALPNGGRILFTRGTFLRDQNYTVMLINRSNIVVEGQGDSTIFQYSNTSLIGDFFKASDVKGCQLKNFKIDGTTNIRGTTSPYTANGILLNNATDCTIENTNISAMRSYAIFADNSSNGAIIMKNRGYGNNYSGVLLQNSHNNQIIANNYTGSPNGHSYYTEVSYNNVFTGNQAGSNAFDCFRLVQANNSVINSNNCQYSQRHGLSFTQTHNATAKGNLMNNVGQAIRFETGASWNVVTNNVIDNNWGAEWTYGGVAIITQDGTTNNTIMSNEIKNSSKLGYYLIQIGGSGHTVKDNILRRRGQTPYSNAIYISTGNDNVVMGNDMIGSGGIANDGTRTRFGGGNLCWNGTWSTTTCIEP